jgi:hypothetical protein
MLFKKTTILKKPEKKRKPKNKNFFDSDLIHLDCPRLFV